MLCASLGSWLVFCFMILPGHSSLSCIRGGILSHSKCWHCWELWWPGHVESRQSPGVCGRAAIIPSLPQPQRDRILTFAVLAFSARLAFRRSLVVRRVDGPGLSGIERATHTREVLTAPAALPWTSCGAAARRGKE